MIAQRDEPRDQIYNKHGDSNGIRLIRDVRQNRFFFDHPRFRDTWRQLPTHENSIVTVSTYGSIN